MCVITKVIYLKLSNLGMYVLDLSITIFDI